MPYEATHTTPSGNGHGTTQDTDSNQIVPQPSRQATGWITGPTITTDADESVEITVEIGPDGQPALPGQPSQQSAGINTPQAVVEIVASGNPAGEAQTPAANRTAENGSQTAENAPPDDPSATGGATAHHITLLQSPKHVKEDLRLIQRALRNGWEVPQKTGRIVPRRLLHLFCEKRQPRPGQPPLKGSDRYKQPVETQIKIAQVLQAMNQDNMKADYADAQMGAGGEMGVMAGVRQLEAARRAGKLVISDAEIAQIIAEQKAESEQAAVTSGNPRCG